MEKKIGGEIKPVHCSSKSLLQNLRSGNLYSRCLFQSFNTDFLKVTVNAWFSILFLPSDCKVSKTSYLIRLYSKLQKFEILALCFRDWNRYFYKDRNSMSSIRLNWEIMFVQDGLSKWHEIVVNSMDINNPWSPSLRFIQNGNHITSAARHIMSYTKSGQTRPTSIEAPKI